MSNDDEKAARLMASAKKYITKPSISLFWKPDHEAAAQDFERAASIYKTNNPELAIQAYEASAEQWAKANSYFMAAKVTEQAAQLASKRSNALLRASELYSKSSDYFCLGDAVERASEALEKAAKCAETVDAKESVAYYRKCIELYEQEERYRIAVDPIKKALAFAIQSQRHTDVLYFFEKLLTMYEKVQNEHGFSRTILSLLIYLIAMEDMVKAKQDFEQYATRLGRDELKCISDLMDAMEANQPGLLSQWKKSPWLQFLDPVLLRLALHIQVSNPTSSSSSSTSIPTSSHSSFQLTSLPIPEKKTATSSIPMSSSSNAGFQPLEMAPEEEGEEDDIC